MIGTNPRCGSVEYVCPQTADTDTDLNRRQSIHNTNHHRAFDYCLIRRKFFKYRIVILTMYMHRGCGILVLHVSPLRLE